MHPSQLLRYIFFYWMVISISHQGEYKKEALDNFGLVSVGFKAGLCN